MNSHTSNQSAQLAQIAASLKSLTESHAELLGFIKKIHTTKESGAGASDNASGTENTDAESEPAPARVYTTQDIVDMLAEKSSEMRARPRGAGGGASGASAASAASVVCARTGSNAAGKVAEGIPAYSSDESISAVKKRKFHITEYLMPASKIKADTADKIEKIDTMDVQTGAVTSFMQPKVREIPQQCQAPEPSSSFATSMRKSAFVRGGKNTPKYLTSHPYIRTRVELLQKNVLHKKIKRKPGQEWFVCLRIPQDRHSSSELFEFKAWCFTLPEAEMLRDRFLHEHKHKIVINKAFNWEIIPNFYKTSL
tara:strand:+ start:56 stop:988 length:933 start_codon:yes stop_codon:yes gene_type:complete